MPLIARTVAGCLGLFIAMNLAAAAGRGSMAFDPNLWWIDLRMIGPLPAFALLALAATTLLAFAVRPDGGRIRRRVTLVLLGFLAAVAILNGLVFFHLRHIGEITSRAGLPFSLVIAGLLVFVCFGVMARRPHGAAGSRPRHLLPRAAIITCTAAACAALFALGQMWCFGRTDYRRPADAIVVFGAGAYADGTCSTALADRVRTACDLCRAGYALRIIMSGGPGDGDVHETQAMARLAVELGVPADAILRDTQGLNTQATCANTAKLFDELRITRAIAVSHFYHLPRIKMTYHSRGVEVFTVPAKQRYVLRQTPYLLAREVAALWVYWARQVA